MTNKNRLNEFDKPKAKKKRRGGGKGRIAKRILLAMLTSMCAVVAGSLAYAYIVPLALSADIPGMVSDGVDAAGSAAADLGEQMGDVTEDIRAQAEGRLPGNGAGEMPGGQITRIVDGDTLDIGDVRVRLALVNTPERGEAGYWEAADFVVEHCPVGTRATYDLDGGQADGTYGRAIAEVWCDGRGGEQPSMSLNEMLVVSGHAEILTGFCSSSEFGGRTWAQNHGC